MLVDKSGKILFADALEDGVDLGDRDLRGAVFKGKKLHGLEVSGADLRGSDFSHCDLYWLNMFAADCSEASFRDAVLEGANLKSACLRGADFTGTIIKADRLGKASSLVHADLTDAKLAGAVVEGTEYDSATVFPYGFDPGKQGMVIVTSTDPWLVKPKCKSS